MRSPLMMTSKGRLLIFVDEGKRDKNSQYVLMIVLGQNNFKRNVFVYEVRSFYRDNLFSEIKNAIEHNESIYITEKTKKWLSRRRASLSPSGNSHVINSITDIL
jgi:hypothetical protein